MKESVNDVRKYLSSDGSSMILDSRANMLRRFTDALRNRLTEERNSTNGSTPMPAPLSEWGYTNDSGKREKEHKGQRNSNFLMNLFETICMCNFGPRKYLVQYHVVYNIPLANLSAIAEAFITVVGQGYIANGGGFCFAPGGESVASAKRVDPERAAMHAAFVKDNVDVAGNRKELLHSMFVQKEANIQQEANKQERVKALREETERQRAELEVFRNSMSKGESESRDPAVPAILAQHEASGQTLWEGVERLEPVQSWWKSGAD